MDESVEFGSGAYDVFLSLLVLARGSDFFSTWLATPNLVLEANPIAKKLGWKWGISLNMVVCLALASWPLPTIVIATTSMLVAGRNFQSAWLMRSFGEERYRLWMDERLAQTNRGIYVLCILLQSLLNAAIGAALILFSRWHLVPLGIGVGMVTYAIAVPFYTFLGVWRFFRRIR